MTPLLLTADGVGAVAAFLITLFIGGCLIGVAFYSLPSLITGEGDQTVDVLLVSLFFGWAALGWLGCLIWAIWYLVGRPGDELTLSGRGELLSFPHPAGGRVLPASFCRREQEQN
jgi:hypothetical protein